MKPKNVEMQVRENEELWDLLEDLMERIQDAREEIADELNELEYMIAETREKRGLYSAKVHV